MEPNKKPRAAQRLLPAALDDRQWPDFVQLQSNEGRFIYSTAVAASATEGDP